MSATSVARNALCAALVLLTSILYGCGGGGGATQSGTLFDPVTKYQGTSVEAVITSDNAEALAMGSLAGQGFGAKLSDIAKAKAAAPVTAQLKAQGLPAVQMAQDLKRLARQLSIPKKAVGLRQKAATAARAKAIVSSNFQTSGSGGGTASYSLQINDQTGAFYGTVTCSNYTSNGSVLDGTCDVLGALDLNRQELSQIALSFKSLSVTPSGHSYTLSGSLSWSLAYASSTETLNMNLVVNDVAASKTYWYRDYQIVTVYGANGVSQSMSGRYYDHDHGFVQVSTPTELVAAYGSQWPYQGTVTSRNAAGKSASVTFRPTTYLVSADTNGDGVNDWQVERPGNATPPINVPPVAAAGVDQTVAEGAVVQLDGSASSDPNGDVLSYYWSFVAVPSGSSTPAISGYNTATPTFIPQAVGTYQLKLNVYDGTSTSEDTVSVTVTAAVQAQLAALKQTWQFGTYGSCIGEAGLLTTDLDGDGTPEIIASASNGGFGDNVMWYVVRKNASGGFDQVWRSENYGVTIARIVLADMNGDGKKDVVVALNDGSIRCYDGPSLTEISRLTVATGLRDLVVADLDGDGSPDLVTTDGTTLRVYGAAGTLKWSKTGYGGGSIAVGNVDADAAKEIVSTSYGGKGYVLSGVTGAVKWEYINGFGALVRTADLDGDGKDEIIGASAWYKITIFDAAIKSPLWEISTDLDIGALLVTDTDGDGIPEIIYGDSQWGQVHAVDARSHQQRWAVRNPEHGVSGIAFGDVDLDGKNEVLWGAGGSSTGPDFLFIADPATAKIKWQNVDSYGMSPLAVGDLNNDGTDQLLMITESSNSGYDGGIIHVFNPKSHTLVSQQKLGLSDWLGEHRVVRVADLDGDGRSEFALSTSNTYDSFIRVYDGATRAVKGKTASYDGNFFSAMAVGDVDGDGKMEIIAGQGREHTGAKGVYLIVFDGTTLAEKWKSVDLGISWGFIYDVKLADLDKDGHLDIIASLNGSRLIVYDGVSHAQKAMIDSPARALEVADVDGDGYPEILAGRSDGGVDVYSGVDFAIKKRVSTFSASAVDALKVVDLDGDGTLKWIVTSGGIMTVLDGPGLYWRSGYLGANLGRANSIAVKDTDRDGHPNIFVGSDTVLYQFKYLKGISGS